MQPRFQRAGSVKEEVLWNFTGHADGADPTHGVSADAAGDLYAGTISGGADDEGTIDELIPFSKKYAETTLVLFDGPNGDSASSDFAIDRSGKIFGNTIYGGRYGAGTAFSISTKRHAVRERVIWSFGGQNDGVFPDAGMVLDRNGALYGTTPVGGPFGGGNVYKLARAGGRYQETILHDFGGGADGKYSAAPVTLRAHGAIYGTTGGGGNGCQNGCGIVFKLTPAGSRYKESALWSFRGGTDGSGPESGVTFDATGAIYGTTYFGGGTRCASGYGCGTAYKLTPSSSGYTEHVIWAFGKGTDGDYPLSNVVIGTHGRLFGTTQQGGTRFAGILWELIPSGSGYIERVLFDFGDSDVGGDPEGTLISDVRHRLYGTTYIGGSGGVGTVFRLTP